MYLLPFYLPLDSECAGVMTDELVVVPPHIVLPQEVIHAEVADVLLNDGLKI